MNDSTRKTATIRPDVSTYTSARAASGAMSKHNGSPVAIALVGATIPEAKAIATACGVENVDKYDALNLGQIRMNLGNRIRGAVAKHEKALAAAVALFATTQPDDATKEQESAHAAAGKFSAKWAEKDFLTTCAAATRKLVDKRVADDEKAKEADAKAKADAKAEKEAAAKTKAEATAKAKADKAAADAEKAKKEAA
jgi:colicin import membrane protein